MVCKRGLEYSEYLEFDWTRVISDSIYRIRSTYHTKLQASPRHLVFGQDIIFNILHFYNSIMIKQQNKHYSEEQPMREKENNF